MENLKFSCLEQPITLRRKLYIWYVYHLMNKLLKKKLDDCFYFNINLSKDGIPKSDLLMLTIAFNNEQVLRYQLEFLRKNLKDTNVLHIIADNSPIVSKQKAIQQLCREYQVGYILLPKSAYLDRRSPSYSHGAAATWLYYNCVTLLQPRYFGFLDHDIYPVEPVSIVKKLEERPFYGFQECRQGAWYIWMGLAFFDFEWVKNQIVNFLPCKIGKLYLDSGGSNWFSLFSKLERKDWGLPKRIRKSVYLNGVRYHNPVDYIDDCWFHTNNASNWSNKKEIDGVLERLIRDFSKEQQGDSVNLVDGIN